MPESPERSLTLIPVFYTTPTEIETKLEELQANETSDGAGEHAIYEGVEAKGSNLAEAWKLFGGVCEFGEFLFGFLDGLKDGV